MRGLEGLRRQWHPLWVQPLREQQPVLGFWHFIAWARKRRECWPGVFSFCLFSYFFSSSFFSLIILTLTLCGCQRHDNHTESGRNPLSAKPVMEGTDISLYFQEDSVIRGTAYKWGEAKVNLGPSFGSDVGRVL